MINVVLDAKNQSFKLCAVDGVDVVSMKILIIDLIPDSAFWLEIDIQIRR